MAIRTSNTITKKEDIDFFLNLTQQQLESLSVMMETFGVIKGKAKFNVYDLITIPPNSYGPEGNRNKNSFVTTLGRWWYNKCFIERDLFHIFHYINEPITNKMIKSMNNKLSYALLEDEITLNQFKKFLMRMQKFQPYSNILCPGYSDAMLNISSKINSRKEVLFKKYEADLKDPAKNMIIADKIEKELLDYAVELLKDDESMDMYLSGAKGSISNNFKNIFVMKGAVRDSTTGEYNVLKSNYIDGISRDEYATIAASLAAGAYSRNKKTQLGGYWEKLLLRACQHIRLAPKGTDCHTKRTITVTLTSDIIDMVMYSYIVEGNDLIELTSKNRDKYLNKTVKIRFASMCEYKNRGQICNACAGNMFYRSGFVNVGAAIPQLASKLKLTSMKAFHDSTVKLKEIDVMKAFGLKE